MSCALGVIIMLILVIVFSQYRHQFIFKILAPHWAPLSLIRIKQVKTALSSSRSNQLKHPLQENLAYEQIGYHPENFEVP